MASFNNTLNIADHRLRYRIGERHMCIKGSTGGAADRQLQYRIGERHMYNACSTKGFADCDIADGFIAKTLFAPYVFL